MLTYGFLFSCDPILFLWFWVEGVGIGGVLCWCVWNCMIFLFSFFVFSHRQYYFILGHYVRFIASCFSCMWLCCLGRGGGLVGNEMFFCVSHTQCMKYSPHSVHEVFPTLSAWSIHHTQYMKYSSHTVHEVFPTLSAWSIPHTQCMKYSPHSVHEVFPTLSAWSIHHTQYMKYSSHTVHEVFPTLSAWSIPHTQCMKYSSHSVHLKKRKKVAVELFHDAWLTIFCHTKLK